MFGMRVEGASNMYVDNYLLVKSVTMPEYRLKKKHFFICYHAVHEAVAGGKVQIGWVTTGRNLANFLNKVLEGPKIREITRKIIHWLLFIFLY